MAVRIRWLMEASVFKWLVLYSNLLQVSNGPPKSFLIVGKPTDDPDHRHLAGQILHLHAHRFSIPFLWFRILEHATFEAESHTMLVPAYSIVPPYTP